MKLQLWSCNYAPEPTGIAPVSTVVAEAMSARGHDVQVVAAHAHYPSPIWGPRLMPYRDDRNGVRVLRLPLWAGRSTSVQRIRQEMTFTLAQFAGLPAIGRPDVMLVVSPSFPALLPAITNARARRLPWVLWLQDILPDGAVSTGVLKPGTMMRVARLLERAAYDEAARVVVISQAFASNLRTKGVPESKLELIYNPVTRPLPDEPVSVAHSEAPTILSMGNIGRSQGLATLVRAFEAWTSRPGNLRLVITGQGVALEDVRAEVRTSQVELRGLISDAELESELRRATLALVSQRPGGTEFNLPSKLMNFLGYGLPVVAVVDPDSEVARIIRDSGGGWVLDCSRPDEFRPRLEALLTDRTDVERRGRAGHLYARRHFSAGGIAERFESILAELARPSASRPPSRCSRRRS